MGDLFVWCEALFLAVHPWDDGVWFTLERVDTAPRPDGTFYSATPGEGTAWRATMGQSPDTAVMYEGVGETPEKALRAVLDKLSRAAAEKRGVIDAALSQVRGDRG